MTGRSLPRRRPAGRHGVSGPVGYCNPPVATRFQPGQSGNPRGRPTGARNRGSSPDADRIWDLLIAEANRPLTINEAGKTVTIPMFQAMFRSLTHAAVKGEHRSQRLLTTLLGASEARHQALGREAFDTAIAYKRAWEQELDRRRTLGLAGADPVPHPDHIIVDFRTGQVHVAGPMTPSEKLVWDRLRARRLDGLAAIADIKRGLAIEERQDLRRMLLEELDHEELVLALVTRVIAAEVPDSPQAPRQDVVGKYVSAGGLAVSIPSDHIGSEDGEPSGQATMPSDPVQADYTPDLARPILKCVSQGSPLHVSCGRAGLPTPSIVRRWLVDQADFLETFRQACQSGSAIIQSEVAAVEENGAADTADSRRALARKWRTVEFPPQDAELQGQAALSDGGLDCSALTHHEQDQLLYLLEKAQAKGDQASSKN